MSNQLRKSLGLGSAVAITAGGVIGSGIFLKPWEVAQYLPDPISVLLCWIGLGLVCLCGGFAYAELGTMFPQAGGQYAFLREGWGSFVAFLYGWCLLLVINSGSIAALSVAFSTSLQTVLPMSNWMQIGASIGMILLLAITNHFGVQWGALLQNISTGAKLIALGGIVMAGVFAGHIERREDFFSLQSSQVSDWKMGVVAAAVAIFWAYEGWHQLSFSAAELKNPKRDLPRGFIGGVIILILTYCAVNAVYMYMVPIQEMRGLAQNILVPKLTIERIFGPSSGNWLAVLICLSVFGAANINLLSTPRAFFAMAKDGLIFKAMDFIHPVYKTPTVAIWTQATWAILLVILLKTFKDITEYVIFSALIFYGLTVAVLYILRWKLPYHPRPFSCIGYPWTPAIFIGVVVFVNVYTLTNPDKRFNALMGLIILAMGIPFYLWIRLKRKY